MLQQINAGSIPVIAIDGPSASGKGTVAQRVAERLGFHYLDSGALYRLVAVAASKQNVALDHEVDLARIARDLPVKFVGEQIFLNDVDVSNEVRSEATGGGASRVTVIDGAGGGLATWISGGGTNDGGGSATLGVVMRPPAPPTRASVASIDGPASRYTRVPWSLGATGVEAR